MLSSAVSTTSESKQTSNYETRIQSAQLGGAIPLPKERDLKFFLQRDLADRLCEAGDNLVFKLFPDHAFGFPINEEFAENFHGIFLTSAGTINKANFKTETLTTNFLNRIITTVACFFRAAGQRHFKPLRYFTASHANTPIHGSVSRKPDIVLVRLVDEVYIRKDRLEWKDVQALVEHTFSKDPPPRMAKTVTDKNYLMFCAQPEKDFIISLCITRSGSHIVVSDHAGQVDTDLIPFDKPSSVLIFLRTVIGFAFLPDKWLGIDTTIIRRVHGQESSAPVTFESSYPPFQSEFKDPSLSLNPTPPLGMESPFAITTDAAKQDECPEFDTITVGGNTYKVLSVLFQSPAFIGRATRVFLVRFKDGRRGVLKDSFITIDRPTEESFFRGLTIPFGPNVIDHCILGDTAAFRKSYFRSPPILETRQKRRLVTYPAGVHISDFTSLWELLVAFLDVTVGMFVLFGNYLTVLILAYILIAMYYLESQNLVHRDISYTNILLRSPDKDFDTEAERIKRLEIMTELGLSDIETLRRKLGCREGLLIDFDYASFLDSKTETGQAVINNAASNVNESLGGSQRKSQGDIQGSSQGDSNEDFEVVDSDSGTVIQSFVRKFSGARTVCCFYIVFALQILKVVFIGHPSFHCYRTVNICTTPSCHP